MKARWEGKETEGRRGQEREGKGREARRKGREGRRGEGGKERSAVSPRTLSP